VVLTGGQVAPVVTPARVVVAARLGLANAHDSDFPGFMGTHVREKYALKRDTPGLYFGNFVTLYHDI
jgi:hypothetical protein